MAWTRRQKTGLWETVNTYSVTVIYNNGLVVRCKAVCFAVVSTLSNANSELSVHTNGFSEAIISFFY